MRASFLFSLIKKPYVRDSSKNYLTKKCALNQGKEILIFVEEDVFFVNNKKLILAKFSVTISKRYVMYVMFYHYTHNLWKSAMFACIVDFRNCQLLEFKPCHCGANSIE